MAGETVLICGAGVSGSVAAYWLARYNYVVTVIERSKAEQRMGQGIEIEQPAVQVVQAMGIMEDLQAVKTTEMGFSLMDEQSRSWGKFEAGGVSPTGDLELMRGDLTVVLYKAADAHPKVTYHFETKLRNLSQIGDKVSVEMVDRHNGITRVEEFDYVIGADGSQSATRKLAMGSDEELDCIKYVGANVAYFSIPKSERDWPLSRACNFPGRRLMWIRPAGKNSESSSVYLIHTGGEVPGLRAANVSGDRPKQKKILADLFAGLGWEGPRIIEGMMASENFYSDELAQVKLGTWSKNRVVLVGDSAWSPTPFTGQGNQLAIIGAFVLAQEMSWNRSPEAFKRYETRLRSYVTESQQIPLSGYGPYLFNPSVAWSIAILRISFFTVSMVTRLILWSGVSRLLPGRRQEDEFDLQINHSVTKKTS